MNAVVERLEVDFVWRPQRLVVEIDGFAYHGSRPAFEKDHRRDARLVVAGYRVLRFTWRQIVDEVERVAADVAVTLGRSGG